MPSQCRVPPDVRRWCGGRRRTQTASYPIGAASGDLEVEDGRIRFAHGTEFGSLDVSGVGPVVHLAQRGDAHFSGAFGMFLASDPAVQGVLVAGNGGDLAVYDVSAEGATLQVKSDKSR